MDFNIKVWLVLSTKFLVVFALSTDIKRKYGYSNQRTGYPSTTNDGIQQKPTTEVLIKQLPVDGPYVFILGDIVFNVYIAKENNFQQQPNYEPTESSDSFGRYPKIDDVGGGDVYGSPEGNVYRAGAGGGYGGDAAGAGGGGDGQGITSDCIASLSGGCIG